MVLKLVSICLARSSFQNLLRKQTLSPSTSSTAKRSGFKEIQKRLVDENYLTADDYDVVLRMLGLNACRVEFDLPMPHLSRDPLLWQQFENLHEGLQGLGDRLNTGMNDGFDKQTAASDRVGDKVSGSLNDMRGTMNDMKGSMDDMKGSMDALTARVDRFMQLVVSQHTTQLL